MKVGNYELIWNAIYDWWENKKNGVSWDDKVNPLPYNMLCHAATRNIRLRRHSTVIQSFISTDRRSVYIPWRTAHASTLYKMCEAQKTSRWGPRWFVMQWQKPTRYFIFVRLRNIKRDIYQAVDSAEEWSRVLIEFESPNGGRIWERCTAYLGRVNCRKKTQGEEKIIGAFSSRPRKLNLSWFCDASPQRTVDRWLRSH